MPMPIGLGLYTIAPFNLAFPVFGIVDDFVLAPTALHALLRLLPAHILGDLGGCLVPTYSVRR